MGHVDDGAVIAVTEAPMPGFNVGNTGGIETGVWHGVVQLCYDIYF